MLRRFSELVLRPYRRIVALEERMARLETAIGRIEARQTRDVRAGDLEAAEFQVFSQWGEDGIIAHLLDRIPVSQKMFVEFGVQDYTESNTRFLLSQRNWRGLVIDGSPENIALIRRDSLYWKHGLQAVQAFITRDNINALILSAGISGDIGLLSVDIDGNDYWVWEAIDCISPQIVVAEYNGIFGPIEAVSVPYDANFQRTRAHYSNLYWGCSLAALSHLATNKGYILVGCNTAGNNAFFVRNDVSGSFTARTAAEAFRQPRFREARDQDGNLTFADPAVAVEVIAQLPLHDVARGQATTAGDILRRAAASPDSGASKCTS